MEQNIRKSANEKSITSGYLYRAYPFPFRKRKRTTSTGGKEFFGMTVQGVALDDRESAGITILNACKEVKSLKPVEIDSYLGFSMHLSLEQGAYQILLKGGGEKNDVPCGIRNRCQRKSDAHGQPLKGDSEANQSGESAAGKSPKSAGKRESGSGKTVPTGNGISGEERTSGRIGFLTEYG